MADSRAAFTGAIARPIPSPAATSGTVATGLSSASNGHCDIHPKPTAETAIPRAVTTPAFSRWVSHPPRNAPTGSPTRNRTSTSAAISWESL